LDLGVISRREWEEREENMEVEGRKRRWERGLGWKTFVVNYYGPPD